MIAVPDAVQVIETYSRIVGLPKPVPRDIGLLESALQRANLSIYGSEMYSGIHLKVAAVIDAISRSHPLLDGNKRLAVVASDMIYLGNDYEYVGGDDDDDLFVHVATGMLSLDEVSARLAALWSPRVADEEAGPPGG